MPATVSHLLLDKQQTQQKIRRVAYEIYEQNFSESEIVLAGICSNGYTFAELLSKELEQISPIQVKLVKIDIEKNEPLQNGIKLNKDLKEFENKSVVITDDVLNTGRTLVYSLKPFLEINIKRLQIAVIVDRGYKLFPVSADYVGYGLSTTLQEHIEVNLSEEDFGVYLR
jgi:pyrimidine operon attenuation protein/uracil phosphoribosyltransferase